MTELFLKPGTLYRLLCPTPASSRKGERAMPDVPKDEVVMYLGSSSIFEGCAEILHKETICIVWEFAIKQHAMKVSSP